MQNIKWQIVGEFFQIFFYNRGRTAPELKKFVAGSRKNHSGSTKLLKTFREMLINSYPVHGRMFLTSRMFLSSEIVANTVVPE